MKITHFTCTNCKNNTIESKTTKNDEVVYLQCVKCGYVYGEHDILLSKINKKS